MNDEIAITKEQIAQVKTMPVSLGVEAKVAATQEQLAYARLLNLGMKIGLLSLIVTFIIYITGILSPRVPVNDLPLYWSMPVHEYLAATGIHPGWSWLGMLGKGDFLNFIAITFLAAVTIFCYGRIVNIFYRKNDTVYTVLAAVEILVLVLAASGILRTGGH